MEYIPTPNKNFADDFTYESILKKEYPKNSVFKYYDTERTTTNGNKKLTLKVFLGDKQLAIHRAIEFNSKRGNTIGIIKKPSEWKFEEELSICDVISD
jgi:hypothetical protein